MNRILYMVAIAASILAIVLFSFQKEELVTSVEIRQYSQLKRHVKLVQEEANLIDLKQYDSVSSEIFYSFLKNEARAVFVSDNDKWTYWSTIEINPRISNEDCDSFVRLIKSPTGYDLVVFRTYNKNKFYFISHLKNNEVLSQKDNNLLPKAKYDKWVLSSSISDEGVQIYHDNGDFILNAITPKKQVSKLLWIDFVLLSLIAMLVFSYCKASLSNALSASMAISIAIIVYRGLYALNIGFEGMHKFKIFSASAYASSSWMPSLGDLLINSILFLLLTLVFLQKGQGAFKKNKDFSWLYGGVILFINCIVFYYISSLFNDSQVSFNFNDLGSINRHSFLGVFIVMLWFMILHYLNASLFRNFEVSIKQVIASLLLALLLSQITLSGLSLYLLLGLVFFTFYYLLHKLAKKFNFSNLLLIEFVVFSLLFTYVNFTVGQKKEEDFRKYYLKKEVYDQKEFIEEQLSIAERAISNDTLLLSQKDIKNTDYSNISKRLTQLYFSSISKDYEVEIYSYSNDGVNIYQPDNQMSISYLKSLYNNLNFNDNLNYFKSINSQSVPVDYIAKYDKCDEGMNESSGVIYLLLKHKSFAVQDFESTNFDAWVNAQPKGKNYSYAIYDEAGLIEKRKGSINYPVALPKSYVGVSDTFIIQDGVSHYIVNNPVYNQSNIVSIKEEGLGNTVTNFSFFVLICLVYGIIILIVIYLFTRSVMLIGNSRLKINVTKYLNYWVPILQFNNLFLSRKIIVSLVSIVLLGFLITLSIVLRFIQESEKLRMEEKHFSSVEEVINRLEGKSFGDIIIENAKNGFLLALADELNKDILIYGKNGELYSSSSRLIKEGKYVAPLAPFEALQKLNNTNTGIEKQNIRIGSRSFTSYYYALLDDNQELTGMLSIPHFDQETILNNNASNLIKTLVNLYALLSVIGIIVVFFIARGISKPLNILSNRLADLKLGGTFKPIEWRGNDEIAQLVKQYNHTVLQLKLSTEKLAETERQGAWKEMAKQVAHEIKNPLTPMRLNLQHLQMSLEREDMKEKKARIIEVLLDQINKLTRLADDFGSFARITESNPEWLNPYKLVESLVMLYDKEPKVSFNNNTDVKTVQIWIDKIAFERVLNNIFKNAIQAMDKEGVVSIEDKVENGIYSLSIKDTGKGIDEELKDKIFNPNFSTKTSGMGIGLALSKRIVENARGSIYFKSEKGKGATFYIEIPLNKG